MPQIRGDYPDQTNAKVAGRPRTVETLRDKARFLHLRAVQLERLAEYMLFAPPEVEEEIYH